MQALAIVSTAVGIAGQLAGANKEEWDAEARQRTAEIQRAQTESNALADLKRTIGNIQAVRASSGARVDSPTSQAIIQSARKTSDINRRREAFSYQNEANIAKADADLIDSYKWLSILGTGVQGLSKFAGYA